MRGKPSERTVQIITFTTVFFLVTQIPVPAQKPIFGIMTDRFIACDIKAETS